jgi:hypothetical protein
VNTRLEDKSDGVILPARAKELAKEIGSEGDAVKEVSYLDKHRAELLASKKSALAAQIRKRKEGPA